MTIGPSSPVPSIPLNSDGVKKNMARTGRPTSKPVNAFLANWLIENSHATVNDAALERNISQTTLESLCDVSKSHAIFAQILELANKMELDPKDLMAGILEGKNQQPISRQEILSRVKGQSA